LDTAVSSALHEPTLYPKHLPVYLRVKLAHSSLKETGETTTHGTQNARKIEKLTTLNSFREEVIDEAERQYLSELLAQTRNDIQEVCRISGLSRSRLYALLKKYDLIKARI
jgi:two-component system NtrC family response regulator